jgi:hypothetical protein
VAQSPYNIGWNQVNKKVTKATRSVIKTADEYLIPKTPADVAMFLFPYGKVAKGVIKGAKKVIKPATKSKKVTTPSKKIKKVAKAAKDEIIMARAGWNDAAKKSYRIDVKRGTYNKPKKVTKTTKKK